MQVDIVTNRQRKAFQVNIGSPRPATYNIVVTNKYKPNTVYSHATVKVDNVGKFVVKMPQTPDVITMEIFDSKTGRTPVNQQDRFKYEVNEISLVSKLQVGGIENPAVRNFVIFAQEFSENAGILSAQNGVYMSNDGDYRIDYVPSCTDRQTGAQLTTPARISRERGVIEISQKYFVSYSVPARMAILLHEFSHFYLNKRKEDETEADMNALLIYLGLGYSKQEAAKIFLTVFYNAPTDGNRKRYAAIKNMIEHFDDVEMKRIGYYKS